MSIKANELSLGNLIDVMGYVEMVTGIIQNEDGNFSIAHTAINKEFNPIPDGILFSPAPIRLTNHWVSVLGVQTTETPEHIKYVHEFQNWCRWHLKINTNDTMNWDLVRLKIGG